MFYIIVSDKSLWPKFQECEAKICQILVNCVIFFTVLSPPYLLEIKIMVCEKILKNKDIHNAS